MLHGSEVVISLRGNEIVATASAFGKIIGQSRGWLQIIRQIEIVAPTDATVLVLGETGTAVCNISIRHAPARLLALLHTSPGVLTS